MARRLLLGPQRPVRNLGDAADAAGFGDEPIAAISAGWQEAEGDIDDVRDLVRRPLDDLGLYARAEQVFAADPALFAAYRRRQDRLMELQRLYQLRLKQLTIAARQTLRAGNDELVAAETRHAVSQLRALDRHHLNRVQNLHAEFEAQYSPATSELLASHREEIAAKLAGVQTVLITGGNVIVLLNRLRLFGVQDLLGGHDLIAWSAGAMILSDLVVLYHDRTARGRRDPEVIAPGCCVLPGHVFLPAASKRLRLKDRVRVDLLGRRFSPAACLTLDSGADLLFHGESLVSANVARHLGQGGRLRKVKTA